MAEKKTRMGIGLPESGSCEPFDGKNPPENAPKTEECFAACNPVGGSPACENGKRRVALEKKDGVAGEAGNGSPSCPACRHKEIPRDQAFCHSLQNRLCRIIGQINGIRQMVEDNRYCGDILTQVSAVESALASFGYLILDDHMKTCVSEKIRMGESDALDEALRLIRKLK